MNELQTIQIATEDELGLVNFDNYYAMRDFPLDKPMEINTDDITQDTWENYYLGIINIFRDGIEEDIIKEKKIRITFGDTGYGCNLFITDLLVNLEMWYMIIFSGGKILPWHLIKNRNSITSGDIKEFTDNHLILQYRDKLTFKLLNNIIDDALCNWFTINEFYGYLADTLNLKDSTMLAMLCPEYNDLLHSDLSNVPIESSNKVALELVDRLMAIEANAKQYLGFDHCNANVHRAKISPRKQIKESHINIGPKPDGNGDVYSHSINKSFLMGGVSDISDFYVDAALARTAQILSHTNVGSSGHFARLLGLNNSDTFISKDINFCGTRRLIKLTLKTAKHLKLYYDRYYKLHPNGETKLIKRGDTDLIGKEIYLYGPMTCHSHSHHKGICHTCYGLLWLINITINAGKISAELISRVLTQILLSAKHILEAMVKKTVWVEAFYEFFDMEYNYIVMKQLDNTKDTYIVIDPDDIDVDNEEDYDEEAATQNMKEHISSFKVVTPHNEYVIKDEDGRDLYISVGLNEVIRKYAEPRDGLIYVPVDKIDEDVPVFYIRLLNNEISRLLDKLQAMINKNSVTKSFTIDTMLQEFIDTVVEGDLYIMGIHCEVILSNQIHNAKDIFEAIDWTNPSAAYKLVTLNEALLNNPSPSITLMYQYLAKTLYTPLTYRKHAPSFLDLFFMKNPQEFLNSKFAKSMYDSENPSKAPWKYTIPPEKKMIEAPFRYIYDEEE